MTSSCTPAVRIAGHKFSIINCKLIPVKEGIFFYLNMNIYIFYNWCPDCTNKYKYKIVVHFNSYCLINWYTVNEGKQQVFDHCASAVMSQWCLWCHLGATESFTCRLWRWPSDMSFTWETTPDRNKLLVSCTLSTGQAMFSHRKKINVSFLEKTYWGCLLLCKFIHVWKCMSSSWFCLQQQDRVI